MPIRDCRRLFITKYHKLNSHQRMLVKSYLSPAEPTENPCNSKFRAALQAVACRTCPPHSAPVAPAGRSRHSRVARRDTVQTEDGL